jgi:hypothetical protein
MNSRLRRGRIMVGSFGNFPVPDNISPAQSKGLFRPAPYG